MEAEHQTNLIEGLEAQDAASRAVTVSEQEEGRYHQQGHHGGLEVFASQAGILAWSIHWSIRYKSACKVF